MNVGFVGTGTMGAPMLGNLVKKGFGVVAYDVAPAALANAEKRGATRAESAADAARRSNLVITMLPSSSHIETAYLGKNGIAEGLTAGRLCRSEEHTSELQSLAYLVCRLLLEKKKKRSGRDVDDASDR